MPARQTRWSYSNGEGTTHHPECWKYHIHCAIHKARQLMDEHIYNCPANADATKSFEEFLEGTKDE